MPTRTLTVNLADFRRDELDNQEIVISLAAGDRTPAETPDPGPADSQHPHQRVDRPHRPSRDCASAYHRVGWPEPVYRHRAGGGNHPVPNARRRHFPLRNHSGFTRHRPARPATYPTRQGWAFRTGTRWSLSVMCGRRAGSYGFNPPRRRRLRGRTPSGSTPVSPRVLELLGWHRLATLCSPTQLGDKHPYRPWERPGNRFSHRGGIHQGVGGDSVTPPVLAADSTSQQAASVPA